MKQLFIFCLSILIFVCCANENNTNSEQYDNAQEYFNNNIRESHIKNAEGHDIILYEVGWRGRRNYSMSIEHNPMCHKCLDFYD